MRLGVLVAIIAMAGGCSGSGVRDSGTDTPAWRFQEFVDPITDARMTGVEIASDTGDEGLVIHCEGDDPENLLVAIAAPRAPLLPNPFEPDRVTYRFDRSAPVEVDAIVNNGFIFIDRQADRLEFLAQIDAEPHRLLLRHVKASGATFDFAFSLPNGGREAISAVLADCNGELPSR